MWHEIFCITKNWQETAYTHPQPLKSIEYMWITCIKDQKVKVRCINCMSVPCFLQYDNMNQWLQVELPQIKKVTGIVTQGARSMGKEMYVTSYNLQYSDNGIHWTRYTDDEDKPVKVNNSKITWESLTFSEQLHWRFISQKSILNCFSISYQIQIFLGNSNNNDHVKNYIYPPIFSRFFRIIPQAWMGSITMRIELLGCDFEWCILILYRTTGQVRHANKYTWNYL